MLADMRMWETPVTNRNMAFDMTSLRLTHSIKRQYAMDQQVSTIPLWQKITNK